MTDNLVPVWIERLLNGGAYGLLILAVIGGFRGWYVWRWQYDEQKAETAKALAERDHWRTVAMKVLGVTADVMGSLR